MTDEYKINEERKGVDVMKLLKAMMDEPDPERPSKEIRAIATTNMMFGGLRCAKIIVREMSRYDPSMKDYLSIEDVEEFNDSLVKATRALDRAQELLIKEARVHDRTLDIWRDQAHDQVQDHPDQDHGTDVDQKVDG